MKKIKDFQNEINELEKLAAQRYLYSIAKRFLLANLIFSIPFIILYFILSLFFPVLIDYKIYISIISIVNLMIMNKYQYEKIKEATIIQEQFDVDILQISWNPYLINKSIKIELINEYNKKYLQKFKDHEKLKNWYDVDDSNIPIEFARLICQRENIWWDKKLKSLYHKIITFIPIIVFFILLIISLLYDHKLKVFINEIFYLSPIIIYCVDQHYKYKISLDSLDDLNSKIETLIDQAIRSKLNPHELTINSRLLQDRIYYHRLNSALVFDYLFKKMKDKYQDLRVKSSNNLIEDYLKIHNNPQ